MPFRFANQATATLASSITAASTSLTVTTGQGALFPSLSGGNTFQAVLVDSSNNVEFVKVTARTGDVLTLIRAQEGSSALAFAAGSRVELRLTSAVLSNFAQLDAANTFTGVNTWNGNSVFGGTATFNANVTFSAGLSGSISGNPTFTGAVAFSGNPAFSGVPTFSNGGDLSGTFSGNPTLSGNPTFGGTPVFSNRPTLNAGLALARDGSTAELYAPISITRGTAQNFAFLSFTRAASGGWQQGLDILGNLIFGKVDVSQSIDAIIKTSQFVFNPLGGLTCSAVSAPSMITTNLTFADNSVQSSAAKGLGIGGTTWQNVTSSRSVGTTYTNSRSYPIGVSVHSSATGVQVCRFYINGNLVYNFVTSYDGGSPYGNGGGFIIVPPGATYSCDLGGYAGLSQWWELY